MKAIIGEWNVFIEQNGSIQSYNIFNHSSFKEDLSKAFSSNLEGNDFEDKVNRILHYYFWSRCEWEVLISGWPPSPNREEEIKVDVLQQIELNWNHFIEYINNLREQYR